MPTGFRVSALLFDMDGTLIDSTAAVDRSWAAWEQRWGVRLGMRASTLGRPARDIVAEHVAIEYVDAAFADIERLEVGDIDGVVVLPGVAELLAALPADRWAIATSCTAPLAEARLRAAGIVPPALVTASDVHRGKPSPDPYLVAAELLGFAPEDCLVVEDAVAGVLAGRAAGCRVLGVLGTTTAERLADAAADAVVTDLTRVSVREDGGALEVALSPS